MPCIKVLGAVKIYIYPRDHNPPHFHAVYAEHEELILIKNLRTYCGKLPKKQRKIVVDWASQNIEYLFQKWVEFNR